jgi:hypothetical protein
MTTFAAAKQRTGHGPKIIQGGHRSAEDARRWLARHLRSKAATTDWPPTRSSYVKAAELLEAGGAPTLFGSVYTIIREEAPSS